MKKYWKVVAIALVVLAVVGAIYAFNTVFDKLTGVTAALENMKKQDDKSKEIIASKEAENKILSADIVVLKETIATLNTEQIALKNERDKKTLENDKLRAELRTAPPETVLEQTKTFLNTREIWLRLNTAQETEAVFSLAAFRLNADVLAEHHNLKFSLVPSLYADLDKSEKKYQASEEISRKKDAIIANKDVQLTEKDKQILARDRTIKAVTRFSLVKDVLPVAAAFFLGLVLGK